MVNIADPITHWVLMMLLSVVMGTFLLIAAAFLRRWQQIRYSYYVHYLRSDYRPILAKALAGERSPSGIEALRELSIADLEIVVDPLFSKRKLTERQLVFLLALCAELGLIRLWQSRSAKGPPDVSVPSGAGAARRFADRPAVRYLLRAKSIRNLGKLRHRESWPLLAKAMDDRHHDIQLLALRSLASMGAPESFPMLRDRLHAVAQGKSATPPLPGLRAAMVSFDLSCVPAAFPAPPGPSSPLARH